MVTFTNQSGINSLLSGANGAADDQVYFNTDTRQLTLSQGTGTFIGFPADMYSKHTSTEEEMMTAAGVKYYWNANKIQGTGSHSQNPSFSRVGGTGLIKADHFIDNTAGQDRYIEQWYTCAGSGDDGQYLQQTTYSEQGYLANMSHNLGFGTQASVYMANYADHFDFVPTCYINQPATIIILCRPIGNSQWGMLRFNNTNSRGFGAHYSNTWPAVNGGSSHPTANTGYKITYTAEQSAQCWIYRVSGGNADGSSDPQVNMRINGVETHNYTLGGGGPHVADPIYLQEIFSHPQNASWGGQGELYEFGIFENKYLDDREVAAFEAFYSQKYNFTSGVLRLAA